MTTDDPKTGTTEGTADVAERFQLDTLAGDIRDWMLERLRWEQDKRPWTERSEDEQQNTIDEAFAHSKLIVSRAVRMIAADKRDPISARVKDVKADGDKIQASVIIDKTDPDRHALFDAAGSSVFMMVIDPEDYEGEREPHPINPDQGELQIDPDTGEVIEPEGGGDDAEKQAQRAESERIVMEAAEDKPHEQIYAFLKADGSLPTLPKPDWRYGQPKKPW